MKIFSVLLFFGLMAIGAVAQPKAKPAELKIAADCPDAIPVTIIQPCKYGPTLSPHSFGAVQEISTRDKNNEQSFAEEHNSAWYLLNIKFDGELSFEIIPADSTDDYDFLLYPYADSTFCKSIKNKTAHPVRSNISANLKAANDGATGLSPTATQLFHRQGPGDPFSKSVTVKKGEKYMLVLDNVTPNGKGHTIYFHALVPVEIKGVVLGPDSQPLAAEVLLADRKGKTVAQTNSGADGKYEIKTAIDRNVPYTLVMSNDSSFVGTQIINTTNARDGHTFQNIKTVLPKLKKGSKYKLGNINFYGNSADLLPESYPSVDALTRLMKKNRNMRIQIEGHVNGAGIIKTSAVEAEYQELSEKRANMIRLILRNAGIAEERMRIVGFAARQMIFPDAMGEEQSKANRRVEIKVISINGEE